MVLPVPTKTDDSFLQGSFWASGAPSLQCCTRAGVGNGKGQNGLKLNYGNWRKAITNDRHDSRPFLELWDEFQR